jgi:hypothetical protein
MHSIKGLTASLIDGNVTMTELRQYSLFIHLFHLHQRLLGQIKPIHSEIDLDREREVFHGGTSVNGLQGFLGHFSVCQESLCGNELCGGGGGWIGCEGLEFG